MPDYGNTLQFGYFPAPEVARLPEILRTARLADELGLDLAGVQDHPYLGRFLDTWTLMTALLMETHRLRVFPDVINLPLRPPAILGKAAATVDLLSNGRFELGLGAGAGAFGEKIAAMQGPRRTPGEALAALGEAIQVIRLMWSGEEAVTFAGQHYRLQGAEAGPRPAHRVQIWVGAYGPRMMTLIGRLADGWLPSSSYLPPERLQPLNQRIDEAAEAAGRNPSAIRRIYNVSGEITEGSSAGFLQGPPSQWIEQLSQLVLEQGMDTFILWPRGDVERSLRRLAAEIIPGVRETVARERAG